MASSSKEDEKDIMDIVAEKLASVKQTLNALDALEDRWKVSASNHILSMVKP